MTGTFAFVDPDDIPVSVDPFIDALSASAAASIDLGPLAPDAGSGLLWLLDPAHWWPDPEAMRASVHVRGMEAVAREALDAIVHELGGQRFVSDQRSGWTSPHPRSWPSLFRRSSIRPTLKEILRWWSRELPATAGARADQFFTHLHEWVQERQLATVLDPQAVDDLRDVAWFEVLLTLVDASVLLPPALGVEPVEEIAPVEAVRIDEHTVDLTVRGELTITLRRARRSRPTAARRGRRGGSAGRGRLRRPYPAYPELGKGSRGRYPVFGNSLSRVITNGGPARLSLQLPSCL